VGDWGSDCAFSVDSNSGSCSAKKLVQRGTLQRFCVSPEQQQRMPLSEGGLYSGFRAVRGSFGGCLHWVRKFATEVPLSPTMRRALALAERTDGALRGPDASKLVVDRAPVVDSSGHSVRAREVLGVHSFYARRSNFQIRQPAGSQEFGVTFTDHMLLVRYRGGHWMDPLITSRRPLELDPASSSLQYGLQIFEGLKAYRPDPVGPETEDVVRLFRPQENLQRMYRSAARLALPLFDTGSMLRLIEEYVRIEADWVPVRAPDENFRAVSLYLRPCLISTDARLGVRRAEEALFYVIASPSLGGYYSAANNAGVTLLATEEFVRAWPGGVGDTKCGGNYALSLVAQELAHAEGCHQVLWLDPDRNVTEAGVMNFFAVTSSGEVVTAPLSKGLILPGVMRSAVIQLIEQGRFPPGANHSSWRLVERSLSVDELVQGIEQGRIVEAFGTGTAAMICPVAAVKYRGRTFRLPEASDAKRRLTWQLSRALEHLFFDPDPHFAAHPWIHTVHVRRIPQHASASHTQFG
jgi:branched-chain amino acid aminotransferase